MPKVTPDQTRSQAFVAAVKVIVEYRKFPPKKLLRVVKWQRGIEKAMEDVSEAHRKMLKEFAQLDANGEFVPMPNQPGTWQLSEDVKASPEKMQNYWEKTQEFNKMEVDIPVMPLQFSEVEKVELSPAEVGALGELLAVE